MKKQNKPNYFYKRSCRKTRKLLYILIYRKRYIVTYRLQQEQSTPVSSEFNILLPKQTKSITERDKDKFSQETFGVVKEYFAAGAQKIDVIPNLECDYTEISAHKISCKLYSVGDRVSTCTIWIGGSLMGEDNSIYYSNQADQQSNNSTNEILTLEEINNSLSFKATLNVFNSGKTSQLSSIEAAEYLWTKFIEPINR